ncbi:MAG: hypothetical protein PVF17_01465 [Ignavibacteria bacterium]|jgi:hypothetical protein
MEPIQVDKLYYDQFLDLLPPEKRCFIDSKVTADKYYLVFEHTPIGGFTTNSDGSIKGLFSLKQGYGTDILNIAIEQINKDYSTNNIKVFCIGDYLKNFYAKSGFNVVNTIKWDNAKAPNKWDYSLLGTPPLYTMEL